MIGRCQRVIRGFSGFPAGSLPGLRFLSRVVAKPMILRDFSARGSLEKIFTLSFPCRQGKGEAVHPGSERGGPAQIGISTSSSGYMGPGFRRDRDRRGFLQGGSAAPAGGNAQ